MCRNDNAKYTNNLQLLFRFVKEKMIISHFEGLFPKVGEHAKRSHLQMIRVIPPIEEVVGRFCAEDGPRS